MFCFAPISLPSHSRDVSNTSWLVRLHEVSCPEAKVGTLNECSQLIEPAQASHMPSISSTFYTQIFYLYFCAKKSQSQTVIRENLLEELSYEKMRTYNVDEINT